MCLTFISDSFPLRTDKEGATKGWKFFVRHENGELRTPFADNYTDYKLNSWYTDSLRGPIGSGVVYPTGFHVYPTRQDAQVALRIFPALHARQSLMPYLRELILAEIRVDDIQTYGGDVSGVPCIVARRIMIHNTVKVSPEFEVVRPSLSIATDLNYLWLDRVTKPTLLGGEPAKSIGTTVSPNIATMKYPGRYVFDPKYLMPLGAV